jgi:hypothetical protein
MSRERDAAQRSRDELYDRHFEERQGLADHERVFAFEMHTSRVPVVIVGWKVANFDHQVRWRPIPGNVQKLLES